MIGNLKEHWCNNQDVTLNWELNVEQPSPDHFYWPDLDVDLGLETIEHPEKFPLKSKGIQNTG